MAVIKARSNAGFTLVEVVVSLAIVGLVLLMGALALAEQRRAQIALGAHREALAAVEQTLELVRAGLLPLEPVLLRADGGVLVLPGDADFVSDSDFASAAEFDSAAEAGVGADPAPGDETAGLLVRLEVEEESGAAAGLYRVRATAFSGGAAPIRRSVETLVWRGGAAP